MNDFNPYSSPLDLGARPPESGDQLPWQVDGKVLRFKDGARLPEIDLYTGREDVPVTPASAEFKVGSPSSMLLIRWGSLLLTVPLIAYMVRSEGDFSLGIFLVVLIGWSVVSRVYVARNFSSARLHWHVDSDRDRKARRKIFWVSRVFWLGFIALMASMAGGFTDWQPWSLTLFFVAIVANVIVSRQALQLRCTTMRDGWFEVQGIPDVALFALAGHQSEVSREWHEEEGPAVIRKMYTAYIYRFSLKILLFGNRFSPLIALIVMIMKITRAKALVRECFDPCEAETLPPKSWDPALRERWDVITESGDYQGWQLLHARKLDSPMGDLLTQWFVLTSSDHRSCVSVALTRVTNARATKEIIEAVFRSWTDDGKLLVTSNVPLQEPLPPQTELKFKPGDMGALRRAHEARVARRSPVVLESAEAWTEKLDEDSRARHQALVDAGFYSPSRDVPLRRRASQWVAADA